MFQWYFVSFLYTFPNKLALLSFCGLQLVPQSWNLQASFIHRAMPHQEQALRHDCRDFKSWTIIRNVGANGPIEGMSQQLISESKKCTPFVTRNQRVTLHRSFHEECQNIVEPSMCGSLLYCRRFSTLSTGIYRTSKSLRLGNTPAQAPMDLWTWHVCDIVHVIPYEYI